MPTKSRVFAMDTHFYTPLGVYPFETRCEMLAELDYDATYHTLWNDRAWTDLPKLANVKERYGLDVAGAYVAIDVSNPSAPTNQRVEKMLQTQENCPPLEIAITRAAPGEDRYSSDASWDDVAARYLEHLLQLAESSSVKIHLYPHINHWMERIEDAVRLCRKLEHPNLGAAFCGFHWFAADGQDVFGKINLARSHLCQVNLCGSRRTASEVGGKATVEPMGQGELDNFAILGFLREIGYNGMIGFQGYSIGGDVYANLRQSLSAFRDMERRLDSHSHWAQMQM